MVMDIVDRGFDKLEIGWKQTNVNGQQIPKYVLDTRTVELESPVPIQCDRTKCEFLELIVYLKGSKMEQNWAYPVDEI